MDQINALLAKLVPQEPWGMTKAIPAPNNGSYITQITDPKVMDDFVKWVQLQKVRYNLWAPERTQDYDMPGYYQALVGKDPKAIRAGTGHYPDYWKTPYHESFSADSKYADPNLDPPKWSTQNGQDVLKDSTGKIYYQEPSQ
jgi:hypothetical protein